MSARVKQNALYLCLLAKPDHTVVKAIITKGKPDLIQYLCDRALNILKGNVPLKKCLKSKLRRFKKTQNVCAQENRSRWEKTYSTERSFNAGTIGSVRYVDSSSVDDGLVSAVTRRRCSMQRKWHWWILVFWRTYNRNFLLVRLRLSEVCCDVSATKC